MQRQIELSGGLLIRNSLMNLAGQALPLLVGLASVPLVVHGLGTERFGLLVFTWTLYGIFSVLDLGLGWSVTRFVAEALGRGDRRAIPGIVWTAVAWQAAIGTIGAAILTLAAAPLAASLLRVAPQMQAEAVLAFRITGLALPVMLMTGSFRGAVEAAQRFDIAAAFRAAAGSAVFLAPVAGVLLGWHLPGILGALLAARIALLGALIYACNRVVVVWNRPVVMDLVMLRRVFAFGGWITVSALAGIVLGYADRFAIGHALTMTALTHYTIPQEMIARLGVLAATLAAVLFPAFSALSGAGDRSRLSTLFSRSAKYAVLLTSPVFVLVVVFARDILRLWLGPDLAAPSTAVLQVLAVGAAVQVFGAVLSSIVQGVGRPDVTAKVHLLEVPVYLGTVWWLAGAHGIAGVALAWSARHAVDALLLAWVVGRMRLWSWRDQVWGVWRTLAPVALLCGLAVPAYALPLDFAARAALMAALVALFYWWGWTRVLNDGERFLALRLAAGWRREPARLP